MTLRLLVLVFCAPMVYDGPDLERRLEPEPDKPGALQFDEPRSEFRRDRDRVLHSGAFRRLQGKTQVVGPHEADYFRTRLTHTLECAQIGSAIAAAIGADAHLVEAACMAHDIGHPPFGHAGEDALREVMKEHGGFEGNAQSFRLLTRLETKIIGDGSYGLNLTRATLAATIKYPWSFSEAGAKGAKKFNYHDEDADAFRFAYEGDGTTVSLEASIMDRADEIAYSVHDLEDGIRARFFRLEVLLNDEDERKAIVAEATKSLKSKVSDIDADEVHEELLKFAGEPQFEWATVPYQRREHQKAQIKAMSSTLIQNFMADLVRGREYDRKTTATFSRQGLIRNKLLIAISSLHVLRSRGVKTIEHGQREMLSRLFHTLLRHGYELLPSPECEDFNGADESGRARVVCDYVAGMTDRYAERLHNRLVGAHTGSVSDLL